MKPSDKLTNQEPVDKFSLGEGIDLSQSIKLIDFSKSPDIEFSKGHQFLTSEEFSRKKPDTSGLGQLILDKINSQSSEGIDFSAAIKDIASHKIKDDDLLNKKLDEPRKPNMKLK